MPAQPLRVAVVGGVLVAMGLLVGLSVVQSRESEPLEAAERLELLEQIDEARAEVDGVAAQIEALRDDIAEIQGTAADVKAGWEDRWRRFHRPQRVGDLWIGPPWEEPDPGSVAIVIDPGRAFGTGGHPTTRLCLELLLTLPPDGALADWGCGSGVLAIAAARLGWAPVVACDHDPASVAATRANAAVNGVSEIAVERTDLRRGGGPWAPTIVANLVRPLLLELAASMSEPPQRLLVSGLLREEAGEVAAAFARRGLRETERRHGGEWAALLVVRQ